MSEGRNAGLSGKPYNGLTLDTSQEQPFFPRTAPSVQIEPNPGLLHRITRNRVSPFSLNSTRALTTTALSVVSQEVSEPVRPPRSSLTIQCASGEFCQASQQPLFVALA